MWESIAPRRLRATRSSVSLAAALLLSTGPSLALAQTQAPPAAPPNQPASGGQSAPGGTAAPAADATDRTDQRIGAQVITVTATKQTQSLQDVPASITALDERSMEIAGIVDPTRLGLVVPGLRVGYSGTEARFAIRGARTNNVGVQAQQVVGVFNDGVYAATVGQVMASYLDLERIEVLRGPQARCTAATPSPAR